MPREAFLWEQHDGKRVKCGLCAHRCVINEGALGFCAVRRNVGGRLLTYAYGKVIAGHVDPIEKKPLYHFLPGASAYSIATAGCNFRCSFCQNWTISQIAVDGERLDGYDMSPEEVVREACASGCGVIAYTYTEPTIFMEYAYDTAMLAREKGLRNVFVTNGYMTPEAVDKVKPVLDAANIDLKFFRDGSYARICKARLAPVLETIKNMKNEGIWVEITTLLVPGLNDSDDEMSDMAEFIASAGKDIPWHVNRFHPDYEYTESVPTPPETMARAEQIGRSAGLKFVYQGNTLSSGNTLCPDCGRSLINRCGGAPEITASFDREGRCTECGAMIEGVWR